MGKDNSKKVYNWVALLWCIGIHKESFLTEVKCNSKLPNVTPAKIKKIIKIKNILGFVFFFTGIAVPFYKQGNIQHCNVNCVLFYYFIEITNLKYSHA